MKGSIASRAACSHQSIIVCKEVRDNKALKVAKSAIAEKFSVAKSTVTSILKNKQKIVDASDTASFTPK